MSGAGKTTLLGELARRGHRTVDTDGDGWERADGTWDEAPMAELLAAHHNVVISGTVENQGRFYDRFEHVVLLSAPVDVLLERVAIRTTTRMAARPNSGPTFAGMSRTSSRCCVEARRWNWTVADR